MVSTTPSADKLYVTESGEVGYTEGPNNFNKYAPIVGVANNEAWCTTFQSWAFKTSGYQSLCLMSNYSVDQYNWFNQRGRASGYPAVGAVVWFGPGGENHTGWVYSYDADYIYTIEGNFGNKVDFHKRLRRGVSDASIGAPFAYGYPNFAEGIITADPNHTVAGSRYQATGTVTKVTDPTPPPPATTYTVKAGDTWASVSTATGLTLSALTVLNPPAVGTVLQLGTVTPPPPPATGWVASVAVNNKTAVSYARYTSGGTVASWIGAACAARGITDTAGVAAWTKGYVTAISRESSGDANACNRNDSNNVTPAGFSQVADFGNGYPGGNLNGALTNYQCSRGVAQCIPQTFAANHCPGTSAMIYDPVANIAASMGYVVAQYGVAHDGHDLASKVQQFDPSRPPKGY